MRAPIKIISEDIWIRKNVSTAIHLVVGFIQLPFEMEKVFASYGHNFAT